VPEIFPIFMAPDQRRELLREKATKSLQNAFPLTAGKYTIHAEDVRVEPEDHSPEDHKMALLQARTLIEPVKATLTLRDAEGKELQKSKDHTVLRLPWLSPHNTFVINGNTFTLANQLRMKPGVYTRKRRDEGIEAAFNLGKGANFRLNMDPTAGTFTMDYGTTRIPLYAALGKLGMGDSEILKSWGKDLLRVNQELVGKNADKFTQKLFNKAVPLSIQKKTEDKQQALQEAFARTVLDPDVTRKTLGQSYSSVTPQALLSASKKLLKAYNEGHDFDERDSLEYKKIYGLDDFISERIGLDARNIGHKIGFKLQRGAEHDLKKLMPSSMFTRGVHQFITTSSLSQNPDQINPLEIIDSASKVTSLGEGGIENDRAIPLEARRLHATHMTVLDPVRTPESFHAGIDLRATMFSGRDKQGNIYTQLKHPKTGKIISVPVGKASESIVAFPDQELRGKVDAFSNGRLSSVQANTVNYVMPNIHSLYAPTTNLVPFLDSDDGMRAQMGSKFMTQAVPLVDAESPLVQVASYRPHMTMEQEIGRMISPQSPVTGTITRIKDGYIYIKPKHKTAAAGDNDQRVPIYTNFPLTSKTYLHQNLLVKAGDEVKKDDYLTDSHFAKDGRLTLGKNLRIAYVPLRGMDTNDAVAISESAAKKLTSLHMHQEGIDLDSDSIHSRDKHRAYYGNKFDKQVYDNLDANGLIKPGTIVRKGDLLVAALKKTELSPESAMLGRLHKSLVKPFQDISLTWEREQPGTIQDIVQTGNKVRMTVKYQEPMLLGSKLGLRHGGKGVVSAIIPDDQMIKDQEGRVIDVAISPTSVLTRLNPGQILETALGKVAEKTGKPVVIENFAPRDNVKYVKDMLAKHGLSDKETIFDPQTGKHIPGVLVGPQYVLKLFKTVDTQYSSRGAGDESYDVNLQPAKGGVSGSKSLGRMELNALLAHNARNIIREAVTTKSEKNDEFWRRYQLGLPQAPIMPTFAYNKFGAMLSGAGIKLNKQGGDLTLMPMTDRDTLKLSRGEITKPLFVRAKDMRPEKDGLFDPAITGGLSGKQYSHYSLSEPVVNPSFERPVKTLLGMTSSEFQKTLREEGGQGIKSRLAKLDPAQRQKDVLSELHAAKPDKRDSLVKELKYLRALDANGLKPQDAYVISKLPIIPPMFRPIIPGSTGDLRVSDANIVMSDAMLASEALTKTQSLPKELQQDAREHLYEATKALYGLREPVSPRAAGRNVQGYLARISGSTPKTGFFQSKLIRKSQDLSGRGVIVPDASLGMDEIGLPEDMGWSMYSPFVVKNLISRGYEATTAKKMLEDRHPLARETLQREIEQRPILMNRAPTLRRYNVMAAYPRLVPGQSIRIHEMQAPIAGGDFDGDAIQVHVPIAQKAVEEAKNLTLSSMILGDQYKSQLLVKPEQDSILGLHLATQASTGKKQIFKSKEEAMAAYHRGEVTLQTPVEIKP
jgi:DNA-directed RNA polymerase beta subunit